MIVLVSFMHHLLMLYASMFLAILKLHYVWLSSCLFFNFYCLIAITYYHFNFPVSSYRSLEKNTHGQSDKIVSLSKWRILNRLHDRNETLYYRVSLMMKLGCYVRKYGNIYFQMVLMLLPFILFRHLLITSKNLLQ
jgi:hypothetical protein